MNRTFHLVVLLLVVSCSLVAQTNVEKWKPVDISLKGPTEGNPFVDVQLTGVFVHGTDTVSVDGFYDGEGRYTVRFMPGKEGEWSYCTVSTTKKLANKKGRFVCTAPRVGNHGPVSVKNTYFFAYADGTPHQSFGTTCYAWVHQGDSMANVTLKTLSRAPFNKLRMCIFPKSYDWNNNEPIWYPFEGQPLRKWDYTRFNPAYFKNIERRIQQLDSLGIEADLILFHPYDRWGYARMGKEADLRYLKYVIARFSAYKNVWWSLANEYDLMEAKKKADWDEYIKFVAETDPYHHLRSIHNCSVLYDHTNPLITHASIQGEETNKAKEYRTRYKKPVIFDECRYEGNIYLSWGNLTAQAMVDKCWRGVINGGYVGHGETYTTAVPIPMPDVSTEKLWWSHGGSLKGESPDRIRFLRQIIEAAPEGIKPVPLLASWMPFAAIGIPNEYYLAYFIDAQPRFTILDLPKEGLFRVEVIDAWNQTITPQSKTYSGKSVIELPGKPYIALRIVKQGLAR